jgi:hypothetical protein
MHEGEHLAGPPTAARVASWPRVIEVSIPEGDTFRVLLAGSHETSTKTLTDHSGLVKSTTATSSTIELLHARGRPVGEVKTWLAERGREKATVTLHALAGSHHRSTSNGPDNANAIDSAAETFITVRLGSLVQRVPARSKDACTAVGPLTVPGHLLERSADVIAHITLENLKPLEDVLDLAVANIEPYLAGRALLIDTWPA